MLDSARTPGAPGLASMGKGLWAGKERGSSNAEASNLGSDSGANSLPRRGHILLSAPKKYLSMQNCLPCFITIERAAGTTGNLLLGF